MAEEGQASSSMASVDPKEDDEYIAKEPGPCCQFGYIHEGKATGEMVEIAGVPTYKAIPAEGKGNGHVVMLFPDVWGMSINSKLIMDGFAMAGYVVLGIDYFRGDPITNYSEELIDRTQWRERHWNFATENVPKWAAAVQELYPTSKFACVGYCFGAPFVCDMLANGVCAAGGFAHPTLVKTNQLKAVRKPLLLSCAEDDDRFPTDCRRIAVDILQENETPYTLQLFQGIKHGFAVKADEADPYQLWCKEQSFRGMLDWFNLWLVRM